MGNWHDRSPAESAPKYLPAHVGKGTERTLQSLSVCEPLPHNTITVLRIQLTRKRVELVPWSIAATRGPSMILFDDAAMVPFIESVSDHSSQKYKTGHWTHCSALRPYSRLDVCECAAQTARDDVNTRCIPVGGFS